MFSIFRRCVASALLLLLAEQANADVQAIYASAYNAQHELIIEVADDGALRVTLGDDHSFILVGGQAYLVRANPGGPTVIPTDGAASDARKEDESGLTFGAPSSLKIDPIVYVAVGRRTIKGYDGSDYAVSAEWVEVTLSTDTALLPTGKGLSAYLRAMGGPWGGMDSDADNLGELLSEHGVLGFRDYQLQSVSFEPIARSRFAVPVSVPTSALDEVIFAGSEADSSKRRNSRESVIRAEYRADMLFTLLGNGQLLAWPEGADYGTKVIVPGVVRSFCTLGDAIVLVTGAARDGQIRLWSGEPGAWSLDAEIAESADDGFLALDCSGPDPIVLTATAIHLQGQRRPISLSPEQLFGANPTTLQHDGFLYLGFNTGEFGGGLRRFPLGGGIGEAIDDSDPNTLCGGMLNSACDPVTGLVADPDRRDCILASTGLSHMGGTHGSIVRICDGKITLAYSKPYTLDPNWRFDPAHHDRDRRSVPFYSLGSSADGIWSVASDGVYLFGKESVPVFKAYPQTVHFPASGVEWSNPEYILVLTTMNQAFSVSGASLHLIPR